MTFKQAYSQLNDHQRLAVDTIEGPVMVLAGPGTGKTQVMAVRIANILERTDAQPYNILAMSFTNAAAKNLQTRLIELIGPAAYGINCSTFHSFCLGVIEENADLFPILPSSQEPISDLEKIKIFETILHSNDFEYIKNAKYPYLYLKDLQSLVAHYKREGYSPLKIRQLAEKNLSALETADLPKTQRQQEEKQIRKNLEVAQVYSEYQRILTDRQLYDFEDLIIWVRDGLQKNEDLRLAYQERFQYFLVDEYQDTNQGQLQVIAELASFWGEQANLFVVGDPNQSIYRFQGASLANTLSFTDQYPEAKIIVLDVGYRCGQKIYDAAAKLIANNKQVTGKPALAALYQPLQHWQNEIGQIRHFQASTQLSECLWVADEIKRLNKQGTNLSDIAVLYRQHNQAELLKDVLTKAGISFQVQQQTNIVTNQMVRQIMNLLFFLQSIRTGEEDKQFLTAFQVPWLETNSQDVLEVVRAANGRSAITGFTEKISPWTIIADAKLLEKLRLNQPKHLQNIAQLFIELQHQETVWPLAYLVENLLNRTGFYHYAQSNQQSIEDLLAVASFLRYVQGWSRSNSERRLTDFLEDWQKMISHNLSLSSEPLQLKAEAATLTTAHSAKGQQWRHVFILHAQDEIWGNLKRRDKIKPLPGTIPYADLNSEENNEDERRLFYVALTRALESVTITSSKLQVKSDQVAPWLPSQFIVELPENLVEFINDQPAKQLIRQIEQSFAVKQNHLRDLNLNESWLKALVENFAFSVTSLQEFKKCPVSFFYRRLIGMPEYPQRALVIGTAVHAAMERLYRQLNRDGQLVDLEKLWLEIDRSLKRYTLPTTDMLEIQAKAKSLVTEYYQAFQAEFKPSLEVERKFGYQQPIVFEGLKLVGKVDRIDLLDAASRQVKVVDYKTGRPKSRNQILGKTKSSDGSLINQLLFYKLLGDLDPNFQYQIIKGEFIFIQPTAAGKYRSEELKLTKEQMDDLKSELLAVRDRFYSLEWLNDEPCGDCDACRWLGLTTTPLETTWRNETKQQQRLNQLLEEEQK